METKNIEIKNLVVKLDINNKGYKTSRLLYDNLNYTIKQGDKILIEGPNGSGKTVLLGLIFSGYSNAFYSSDSNQKLECSGEIYYNGENIFIPSSKRNNKIIYLSQQDEFRSNSTVISEIESSCRGFGIDPAQTEISNKIDEYLKMFGLYEKKNCIIGEAMFSFFGKTRRKNLSYGEAKCVHLISKLVIANYAEVMLLDEPLNHLSFENSKTFNNIMNSIVRENENLTILVVSHCKAINFINKKIRYSKNGRTFIEYPYKSYDCFDEKIQEV